MSTIERTREYELVMDLLEGLGLNPNSVESIHIDNEKLTVVGFVLDDEKKLRITESGTVLRFAHAYDMRNRVYAEEGDVA